MARTDQHFEADHSLMIIAVERAIASSILSRVTGRATRPLDVTVEVGIAGFPYGW
jgi:hypothetical protein